MSDEWGPWIEHDGVGCPVPNGTYLRVISLNGVETEGRLALQNSASHFHWPDVLAAYGYPDWCIVRYRVRASRGFAILEEIAKVVREPVDV